MANRESNPIHKRDVKLLRELLRERYAELPKNEMSNWYDIRALLGTLFNISLSEALRTRLDRRVLQPPSARRVVSTVEAKKPEDRPNSPSQSSTFFERDGYFEYVSNDPEFWFDYAADVGDGFNATYYVAALLAQDQLTVRDQPPPAVEAASAAADSAQKLPRGRFLILGGDQVYPSATREAYEQRFARVYEAAAYSVTCPEPDRAPQLYAIPGNHDWYDGLGSFMEVFADQRTIGQWRTVQKSSYFALKLPHRFWLFALDIGLGGELDKQQVEYFQELVIGPVSDGDRIILCLAEPDWVKARANLANLRDGLFYFERKLAEVLSTVTGTGPGGGKDVRIILRLAGDLHHYRRHVSQEPLHPTDQEVKQSSPAWWAPPTVPNSSRPGMRPIHNITAGGGGAFLHPTHELNKEPDADSARSGQVARRSPGLEEIIFDCVKAFPDLNTSHKLTYKNLGFSLHNRQFFYVLAALYAVLLNLSLYLRDHGHHVWICLQWVVVSFFCVKGAIAFAQSEARGEIGEAKPGRPRTAYQSWARKNAARTWGVIHGLVHILVVLGMMATSWLVPHCDGKSCRADLTRAARACGIVSAAASAPDQAAAQRCEGGTASHVQNALRETSATGQESAHWIDRVSVSIDQDYCSLRRFGVALVAGIFGAFLSLSVFGIYLLLALNFSSQRLHANGAFASLRIADYKNFLRLCINARGVTVFAIGIEQVPKQWELDETASRVSLFHPRAVSGSPASPRNPLTQVVPRSEPFLIERVEIPK